MSNSVSFSYEEWSKTDVMPKVSEGTAGFHAIQDDISLGHLATRKQERGDPVIGRVEDEIIELIAGGLEFLRKRGIPSTEVEQRVLAYLRSVSERPRYKVFSDSEIHDSIYLVSAEQVPLREISEATLALVDRK